MATRREGIWQLFIQIACEITLWLTDGTAWKSARGNLKETFDTTENVYSIVELENGALENLFKG